MGYFIQKNFLKGFIEERRVNGVGVSYSVNIQYIRGSGCKEEPDSGSFSINNATDSERRYFTLTQTFDLGFSCNTSSLDLAEKPVTIKDRGTGPLPAKYKSLYSLLEGRANIANNTKLNYPSDASYKQVDAELTKTSVIFNLLQLFPEKLSSLSPSNYVEASVSGPTDRYGNPYQASACCWGTVHFDVIIQILSYDEQKGSTIRVYGKRTATTRCFNIVDCEKNVTLVNIRGEKVVSNCSHFANDVHPLRFSTNKVQLPIPVSAGSTLVDYTARGYYSDRGILDVKNYGTKIGCCDGMTSCPEKFKTDLIDFTFTFPRKFNIIPTVGLVDGEFDKYMEIGRDTLMDKYGFDSDNPPVFKSCKCASPVLQGTSTTSLM